MMRFLSVLALLALALPTSAAPPKTVTLRWYGQSFFVLQSSTGTRVAFDPHALEAFGRPTVQADLVLISHPHPDHTQVDQIQNRAKVKIIEGVKLQAGPGGQPRPVWNPVDEQFKDVHVRNVGVYHDVTQGLERGKNSVFIVETDGLRVVHLGDLGHLLSDDQVKQIGPVDVLLIPVGGVYTINGEKAKEVIAQLKPKMYVVPMHYGIGPFDDLPPLDEFLDGLPYPVQRLKGTNELTIATDFRPEKPVVVLPGWKKGE